MVRGERILETKGIECAPGATGGSSHTHTRTLSLSLSFSLAHVCECGAPFLGGKGEARRCGVWCGVVWCVVFCSTLNENTIACTHLCGVRVYLSTNKETQVVEVWVLVVL